MGHRAAVGQKRPPSECRSIGSRLIGNNSAQDAPQKAAKTIAAASRSNASVARRGAPESTRLPQPPRPVQSARAYDQMRCAIAPVSQPLCRIAVLSVAARASSNMISPQRRLRTEFDARPRFPPVRHQTIVTVLRLLVKCGAQRNRSSFTSRGAMAEVVADRFIGLRIPRKVAPTSSHPRSRFFRFRQSVVE